MNIYLVKQKITHAVVGGYDRRNVYAREQREQLLVLLVDKRVGNHVVTRAKNPKCGTDLPKI